MYWVNIAGTAFWIALAVTFPAVAAWESFHPLRGLSSSAERRWGNHALLYATTVLLTALVFRASPILVAFAARDSRYGLLNRAFVPGWVNFAATILLLDLFHYGTHRAFHSLSLLWRFHQIHHSDRDFDVSTSVRFHPIEALATQAALLGAVAVLAPPPAAVFVSQILLLMENLFTHANQALPPAVERTLRWIVFTPELHRIHHSEEIADQQLNYGQLFPWWDMLFGTYARASARGPEQLVTGLKELRSTDTLAVSWMLAAPFRRGVAMDSTDVTTDSTIPAPTRR